MKTTVTIVTMFVMATIRQDGDRKRVHRVRRSGAWWAVPTDPSDPRRIYPNPISITKRVLLPVVTLLVIVGIHAPSRVLATGPCSSGEPTWVLGGPQTLLPSGALGGLCFFPDQATVRVPGIPGFRLVIHSNDCSGGTATGGGTYLLEGPDITHLDAAVRVLTDSQLVLPVLPGPDTFDSGYAGISGLHRYTDGRLYGFYHAEGWTTLIPADSFAGLSGYPGYYASVGEAVSDDDGLTWQKLGRAVTGYYPPTYGAYPRQSARGVAIPSVVADPTGTYLYVYYEDDTNVDASGQYRRGFVGMARADLREGPPVPGQFKKYYAGAFTEPGLGGRDEAVLSAQHLMGASQPHVVYSEYLSKYVMVVHIASWTELAQFTPLTRSGMYVAFSDDAVTWSEPALLLADYVIPVTGKSLSWQANILWDDNAPGHKGWLVYGHTDQWPVPGHYMVGRRIEFACAPTPTPAPTPVAAPFDSAKARYLEEGLTDEDLTSTRAVSYGSTTRLCGGNLLQDLTLHMDIYEPAADPPALQRPVIIFADAGSRTDQNIVSLAKAMARRGYVTATIDYRLCGEYLREVSSDPALREAVLADMQQDVLAAVRWFRAHAVERRINPDRIMLAGNAYGATAALTASFDPTVLTSGPSANDGSPGFSSAVSATVSIAGIADPAHITAGDPPVALIHHMCDNVFPKEYAFAVEQQSKAVGVRVEPNYLDFDVAASRCAHTGVRLATPPGIGPHNIVATYRDKIADWITGFFYRCGLNATGCAAAGVLGTGPFWVNLDTTVSPFTLTGRSSFDNQEHRPFGLPLNLGTPAGSLSAPAVDLGGVVTPPPGSTFQIHAQTSPDPGRLSYNAAGSIVCPADQCTSGADDSFVGAVTTSLNGGVGQLLSDLLPPNLTFTIDGTAHFLSSIPGVPDCNPPAPGHQCFRGVLGLNAFEQANTYASTSPVEVHAAAVFYDSSTQADVPASVTATYASVQTSGTTEVTVTSAAAGIVQDNFAVNIDGYHAMSFDVSPANGLTYTGPVTVCITLNGTNSQVPECAVFLLHEENGRFVNRTPQLGDPTCPLHPTTECPSGQCLDPGAHVLCASVNSLSAFVAAVYVPALCGNGIVEGGEQCDDGNLVDGDGCSVTCQVEPCWSCSGQASVCTPQTAGTQPAGCTGTTACNGSGTCALANGQTCSMGLQCSSGSCATGVCGLSNGHSCTSAGQCASNVCSAGACQGLGNGQSCSSGPQCASGLCNAGVCRPPGGGIPALPPWALATLAAGFLLAGTWVMRRGRLQL